MVLSVWLLCDPEEELARTRPGVDCEGAWGASEPTGRFAMAVFQNGIVVVKSRFYQDFILTREANNEDFQFLHSF